MGLGENLGPGDHRCGQFFYNLLIWNNIKNPYTVHFLGSNFWCFTKVLYQRSIRRSPQQPLFCAAMLLAEHFYTFITGWSQLLYTSRISLSFMAGNHSWTVQRRTSNHIQSDLLLIPSDSLSHLISNHPT